MTHDQETEVYVSFIPTQSLEVLEFPSHLVTTQVQPLHAAETHPQTARIFVVTLRRCVRLGGVKDARTSCLRVSLCSMQRLDSRSRVLDTS
jgi:hypothetical protein